MEIVEDLKGFAHVIDAISKSKKVVVGHNAYVDIFLTYQEFCNELPESYEEFKTKIVKVFPQIVDTKRLAHAIKDHLSHAENQHTPFETTLLSDTNLFSLHFNTQLEEKFSPKVITSGEYKPVLEQAARRRIDSIPDNLCHDAAFDACITGCVFIQLAYLIQRPSLQFCSMPATAREQLYGCNRWFNVVNATRCTVPYINLQGDDPKSHRPAVIFVVGHKNQSNLLTQVDKLHRDLPKFGDYDLKIQAGGIVITCGNIGCYRGVSRYLSEEEFIVKDRSKIWNRLIQHTACMKFCGAIVVTGAVLYWRLRDRS
jgi:poly(A)-specific ribonuclease